jgi:methionyl-tRNA synthetase
MTTRTPYALTTAIPYVNARPHLGHALEYIQSDAIARWHRQLGEDVFFLSGADENSLKNVRAAEAEGVPTRELVDRNTQYFIDLMQTMEVSLDDFIRTVEAKHFAGVQKLIRASRPEDIYKQKYSGLYCVGCEAFYQPEELVDGKCPEHLTPPELIEEENYFFKLSNYQAQLEELIASDTYKIVPAERKNEILSFIRSGLKDFSISRSQERARGWGIPFPGDEKQVVYVWYDALGNYITGMDYAVPENDGAAGERYGRYWPAALHVIGKGIIRFHAVYWPAMLLSAGVPLPKALFVHGYITVNGQKMSKSLGAVVDPLEVMKQYGVEPVRYYMLRYISPTQDGDFSEEQLRQSYTSDLANGIGNLLSRTLAMIEKNADAQVRVMDVTSADEAAVVRKFEETFVEYERLMNGFEFSQALSRVWEAVATLDKYINDKAPWHVAKDPARREELLTIYWVLAEGLRCLGSLLHAAMPKTAEEIWHRLGLAQSPSEVSWEIQKTWGLLQTGFTVTKGAPLFPRLEEPAK